MAPIRVFVTGATGYIGSTTLALLLKQESTASKYTFRILVRSQEKADRDLPPTRTDPVIEPVIGSLDDSDILKRESSNADVVLHFADADHYPAIKAILEGLQHQPRPEGGLQRPILIHTSGTGVLLDGAYGKPSDVIYHDNDLNHLNSLAPEQLHRNVDLEIISPSLIGKVDTYVVAPPTIWGFGIGPGLNKWSKVHVEDLGRFYILLLERSLQEPQDGTGNLPKNLDAYYFAQEGDDFTYGSVGEEIAHALKELGVNDSDTVKATTLEEEEIYWTKGSGSLVGGNSRSRAIKAREILGWEPKHKDFKGHIRQEVERQYNLLNAH
ncbi:hypothetical protein BGZ65_003148 [Modicella reniformis]|uniref:NAD-dependent epimerase/dehydratase domain-containing protein n=1 Tax=Modicella reniformis TaxID=1440133 RepID=A0A9P6LTX2_9FUNG|nr:hypothetical protein BGZ65_003148 [Modicella reniformis]